MSVPYNQTLAPCGTANARRRHARKNETCEACGPLQKRSPLAPCGTRGAKERHRRRGETCTACTPKRKPQQLAPCGTPTAYRRHLRNGQPIDEACAQAARDKTAAYRRAKGIVPRAYTNKPLPELLEEITFLLNAGEGTARLLAAIGYTGREAALRERLRQHGHTHLANRILNPWELAA